MLSLEMIKDAQAVLQDVVLRTPMMELAPIQGANVFVKAENLQVAGSFKMRGAYYKMSTLTKEERDRGVITCSAGNFAQGVAYAATKSGIRSVICVPAGASKSKIAATKALGGEVVPVEGVYYEDAFAQAVKLGEQEHMTFLHAFEDPKVIAGAGTIGLEILEQLPQVDVVLAPIGGGGLLSGIACAIKSIKPACKLVGVQLEGAACMYQSRKQGEVVTLARVEPTFADGMAGRKPGAYTFSLCEKYVDDIVLVSDEEVAAALVHLLETKKLLAEGAGASTLAAVMFNKLDCRGKNVLCVVSGGNIDSNVLTKVLTKGLIKCGKLMELSIDLLDRPGELEALLAKIQGMGGKVANIRYDREHPQSQVSRFVVHLVVEADGPQHCDDMRRAVMA